MTCPVCQVPLSLSERQGIEIDYCPQCRGVWLDRGELGKILERAGQAAPPHAPEPRSRPHDEQYQRDERFRGDEHSPYRKRKNWLEELFD